MNKTHEIRHQQPLDYLDHVPSEIYRRLVTHRYRAESTRQNQHSLQQRCLSMLAIRDYLLTGETLQSSLLENWLKPEVASLLYQNLSRQSLLSKTRGNESYTDQVVSSILDWLDQPEHPLEQWQKQAHEHEKLQPQKPVLNTQSQTSMPPHGRSNVSRNRASSELQISPAEVTLARQLQDKLCREDKEDVEFQQLNKRFALQRSLGWDLKKGIKNQSDTKLLLKYHRLIKSSKQLKSILHMIGRGRLSRVDSRDLTGLKPASIDGRRQNNEILDACSVDRVTGVYPGDDIARMLPSELQNLGHPVLKKLWYARRADQQLLSYRFQGVSSEHIPETRPQSIHPEPRGKRSVRQQGPIIMCIDTSASMKGKPETIAKAVALEAVRVARLESRECFIFSFSGEGEIAELKPELTETGWQPVIDFLSFSFQGGTDINAVMYRALGKLTEKNWKRADLVLVSDGRFTRNHAVIQGLRQQDSTLRVFGINVSHWNSSSFGDICHQTFILNHV